MEEGSFVSLSQLVLSNYRAQVVIAALNEEKGIGKTIAELKEHLPSPRVIVVDGQSDDRTIEVAKNLGADIYFQDGIGKGDAFAKGVKNLDDHAKYVVITDADFTYPAEYVPEMIRILEERPEVGMVCGNRFWGETKGAAFNSIFTLGNKLIALTHSVLNGVNLQDPLTGLRVVRADLLRGWEVKSKGFDMEVEMNAYIERKGYKIVEIPIHYRQRLGKKKLKVSDGLEIFKRILLETAH